MAATAVGFVVVIEIVVLVTAVAGGYIARPRWSARRRARTRRAEIDDALPEVADLLLVVLGAGASVSQSVSWLVERGPIATQPAFEAVVERTENGQSLVFAMSGLVDDLGPAYWPMVTALTAAVRDGAPTSMLLLRLGDEARSARRRSNDRAARALPVQMLFPLVCCSLPAVLVGAVLPLVLVAFGRL